MSATIPSSQSGSGKERLERALFRISRPSSRPAGRKRPAVEPARGAPIVAVAAPAPELVSEPISKMVHSEVADAGLTLPAELVELVERLDNIADRLADLEHPGRPLPATRAIFAEWVRLRKWEEIPFLDFLTLRRAGRL